MREVYHKKEDGRRHWRRPFFVSRCLRGEAAEGAAHVPFAQTLERPVAKLAHTLARDTEHGTDFLERMLAAAFEAEVEAQHFRVARRQRAERLLDFVSEEAVHRFLFGIGHLVGDEALEQR